MGEHLCRLAGVCFHGGFSKILLFLLTSYGIGSPRRCHERHPLASNKNNPLETDDIFYGTLACSRKYLTIACLITPASIIGDPKQHLKVMEDATSGALNL